MKSVLGKRKHRSKAKEEQEERPEKKIKLEKPNPVKPRPTKPKNDGELKEEEKNKKKKRRKKKKTKEKKCFCYNTCKSHYIIGGYDVEGVTCGCGHSAGLCDDCNDEEFGIVCSNCSVFIPRIFCDDDDESHDSDSC